METLIDKICLARYPRAEDAEKRAVYREKLVHRHHMSGDSLVNENCSYIVQHRDGTCSEWRDVVFGHILNERSLRYARYKHLKVGDIVENKVAIANIYEPYEITRARRVGRKTHSDDYYFKITPSKG